MGELNKNSPKIVKKNNEEALPKLYNKTQYKATIILSVVLGQVGKIN